MRQNYLFENIHKIIKSFTGKQDTDSILHQHRKVYFFDQQVLPDYSDDCPLYHGKNCAVRIGHYVRKKMIVHNKTFNNVPIPRWKCRRKGHANFSHKTFSLLPHPLVPYHQQDIELSLDTVKYINSNEHSLEDIKELVSLQGIETEILIENSQIHGFENIFAQSFVKLLSLAETKSNIMASGCLQADRPAKTVIDFIDKYQSPMDHIYQPGTSNAEKLAMDFFFHYQTGDYFQRDFLFGTCSQKR